MERSSRRVGLTIIATQGNLFKQMLDQTVETLHPDQNASYQGDMRVRL